MKKIFIFKPSEHWSYCGGGRVVIAETFEEVEAMFPDDKMWVSEPDKTDETSYMWTLVATFPTNDQPNQVVLDDQNWA